MSHITKIGFGGGCHWCTEAVFMSLKGVNSVAQGWIASFNEQNTFSEAVIVEFNPNIIPLEVLIEIHLHTHKSTSNHSMRDKYRSAIYYFEDTHSAIIERHLNELQPIFNNNIITQVLAFKDFNPSREAITNYYYANPKKPFCEQFIKPKLQLLLKQFRAFTDERKLNNTHI